MTQLEKEKALSELYFKPRNEERYPIRRGEKLEPGKVFRARNGERVRIYAIEGGNIHGAILHNKNWEVDVWRVNGEYAKSKFPGHARDILLAPPLLLKPGGLYKTRDGRPAKVFEINRGHKENPVLGAIKDNNVWLPRIWNEEGITKRPYGPNNDIVTEWSES